jgi:hypothetical protein
MKTSFRRYCRGRPVIVALVLVASLPPAAASGVGAVGSGHRPEMAPLSGSRAKPAWVVAASLPIVGGTWTELTTLPYDLEDPLYRAPEHDQYFSGSGYGFAGGRVQALAVDGDTVYAGAASGGVWRSPDQGRTWTPVSDDLPSLSSGDLVVDPSNGDVWYATGEAAGYSKIYRGVGVFRSRDRGETWELTGGDQLDQTLIGTLEFDGIGNVYAATSHGLYRRSTSAPASEPWTVVLRPGTPGPYGFTFANDVVVRPGTEGQVVVASFGWREGDVDHNGLYVSREFGLEGTWQRLELRGELDSEEIGRASLAYSTDGTRLYALVQAWRYFAEGRSSTLYGVFISSRGNPRGPWRKIAGTRTLTNAKGSFAAINPAFAVGSHNGVQAIAVDPADRDHLYVGLLELFETRDAGRSWTAAGPAYCGVGTLDLCRNTTHADHHALAFSDGIVYSGNDGGVYRRPVSRHMVGGWTNLNQNLHALQYYAAGVSNGEAGEVFWGGNQDNGVSLLRPGASTMVAPHCCEAFNLIVDPSDPDRAALVHVDFAVTITTNGGLAEGFRDASPPDPRPSAFNVLRADPLRQNRHWVFGGKNVWETRSGWKTRCTRDDCDWMLVDAVGPDRMVSSLDVSGDTIYVGWCGPVSCDPHPHFASGIDTNVGGEWHRVVGPGIVNGGFPLPNRWISSLRIDSADPLHVYAVYGEYRRPWTAEPRSGGHVFESTDGGHSWTDISGNLPAAPATDLIILGDKLVVSMDVGVFVADAARPTLWSRLGTGIPNAAVNSLTLTPDGGSIVAATYGRGLWSIETP